MTELLQTATAAPNIIPTALLAFVLLYWLSVIIGLADLDLFHFQVETEIGSDGPGGETSVAWLNNVLGFFNMGKVPFMVFMSFLALPLWTISILDSYYLSFLPQSILFLLLIPALFFSLFIAKILTAPFVKMFAALEKEHDSSITIIGQVCTVLLPASEVAIGQAAIKTGGAPLILNVKTTNNRELKKGETGLVIDYKPDRNYYIVEPYETIN